MGQLVNNDTSLEVAVAVRVRGIPQVHPAPAVLPIWRGHEVRIIVPGPVLGVCDNGIAFRATTSEVVLLEVARDFIKAVAEHRKSLGHIDNL